MSSSLANLDAWTDLSVDELAQLYDSKITTILDRMIPVKTVRCRRRSSDPWFDDEYRVAKRCVRHFERAVCRVAPTDVSAVAAATASWKARRHEYRTLLKRKRESFRMMKIDALLASTAVALH